MSETKKENKNIFDEKPGLNKKYDDFLEALEILNQLLTNEKKMNLLMLTLKKNTKIFFRNLFMKFYCLK